MKKLLSITLVSVVIILIGSLTLAQEHWVYVTKDIQGSWYYDSNSIKHLPNKDLQVKIRYEVVKTVGDEFVEFTRKIQLAMCKNAIGKKTEPTADYALGIFIYEFTYKDGSLMDNLIYEEYYDGNNTLLCSRTIGGSHFTRVLKENVNYLIYNEISK